MTLIPQKDLATMLAIDDAVEDLREKIFQVNVKIRLANEQAKTRHREIIPGKESNGRKV